MYQFFVDDAQIGKEFITITGSDVNHIRNVLRMKPGEKIRVSNQKGQDYLCSISEFSDDFVQADILDSEAANTELSAKIYLFQALPKGDRMETVIQKAVELGVHEIIPVSMKYCVVKLDAKKAENKRKRWQAIAESAAKQSKRSLIPVVREVMNFDEAVAYAKSFKVNLVPYENERGMAVTRKVIEALKPDDTISVMIGPEGGFSAEEIEKVKQENMKIISLGKRILRTDTAAISTLSMLMLHLEMSEQVP